MGYRTVLSWSAEAIQVSSVPAVWWKEGDDWTCGGPRVWWELHDSWCFHVEIAPWPPRAGVARLTFRYGPNADHMMYAIRTEPPIYEERKESIAFGLRPQSVHLDQTPWEWQHFSPEGFQSEGPPFWADIKLPAGRIWVAFVVEQQDHDGEWFENPVLDDWILDVAEARDAEQSGA